ncbi:YebO family protein [Sodalis sp. dw_96]|uniref:YebO family protein n=1 Tax=Sodalis sp. dw_96 TaxID=2719794 RepID=UPI001BD60389|nr:YebO family protein [Sodalis sp. dw_96]
MNDFGLNTANLASMGLFFLIFVIGLIVWFFLNRASVRANEQITLLNELLEQQKKQTEILIRLGQGNSPQTDAKASSASDPVMFKDFIAER